MASIFPLYRQMTDLIKSKLICCGTVSFIYISLKKKYLKIIRLKRYLSWWLSLKTKVEVYIFTFYFLIEYHIKFVSVK